MKRTPIFVHSWWRSGSTYIWAKLREEKTLCCYYEPLHEQISDQSLAAIDAPPSIEASENFRHPILKTNYFAEYAGLLRSGKLYHSKEFAYDNYLLQPQQPNDQLRSYIEGLITSALDAGRRPVLCFCRSQMRSAWMKETFGGIHVAQIRNPFDQWSSFQIRPYFPIYMVVIALKLRQLHPLAFAHIEAFEQFAQQVSKRAWLPAEMLAEHLITPFISQRDCFDIFLIIWIVSALQTIASCDFLLDIDRLSSDLEYRNTTSQWFNEIGCSMDLSDCSIPNTGDQRIQSPFFQRIIEEAVNAVRSQASPLVIADISAVKNWCSDLAPSSRSILSSAVEM